MTQKRRRKRKFPKPGPGAVGRQCAALPFADRAGEMQVMLVTSRETRRWVLPKGWCEKSVPPHEQAAIEAYEEAGLIGEIASEAIGRYRYAKRLPNNLHLECEVEVFPLRVDRQVKHWPEKRQRQTAWFTLGQAALVVEEAGLAMLLVNLALPEA
jgi:8-oxo-dGTP pyrophosphatase MutT (NUDIX family)